MRELEPLDQALQVIAGVIRDGVAKHPDNDWTRRSVEYHVGRAEEHLRLLRDGDQREDHLTRRLFAGMLGKIAALPIPAG